MCPDFKRLIWKGVASILLLALAAPQAEAIEINTDTTWSLGTVPALLTEWVNVNNGATLTIEAGVTVNFGVHGSALQGTINVNNGGTLVAVGTSGERITFTSGLQTPAAGDWGRIRVHPGGTATLSNCDLEFGGDFGEGSLFIQSSDVSVSDCAIREGEGSGVYMNVAGISPTLDALTVENCGEAAIKLNTPDIQANIGDALSFSGNLYDAILVIGGSVTQATNWTVKGTPYAVSGWVEVADTASLNLTEGVVVQFLAVGTGRQSLIRAKSGGTLSVQGSVGEPVSFTSGRADPAPGDWAHLQVEAGGIANINHCTLEYGGDDGMGSLYLQSSGATISNCEISNGFGDGVYLSGAGTSPELDALSISDCTGSAIKLSSSDIQPVIGNTLSFSGNGVDAIHVLGGIVRNATTWTVFGTPYAVSGWIYVEAPATLRMEPGVEVLMMPVGTGLQSIFEARAGGRIETVGTEAKPVRFTSGRETPAPGDWGQIRIHTDGSADFDYTEFEYGGDDGAGTLRIRSSEVHVNNCTFRNGLGDGILLDTAGIAPVLDGITVDTCTGSAVHMTATSINPTIGNDLLFTGNGIDAIHVEATLLEQAVTWTVQGTPYGLSGWLDVGLGGVLTIEEGVELQMLPIGSFVQTRINVNEGGEIALLGTESNPVHVTSGISEPAPGDWAYINVNSGAAATLNYSDFEYGGNRGNPTIQIRSSSVNVAHAEVRKAAGEGIHLYNEGIAPSLDTLTIEDCERAAMVFDVPDMQPVLDGALSFINNEVNAITIRGGTIQGDRSWTVQDAPYAVADDIEINGTGRLSITEGVRVEFLPNSSFAQTSISATGESTFTVQGSAGNEVLFTSARAEPAPGDWGSLYVEESATGTFSHVICEYGGWSNGAIGVFGGSTSIADSTIRESASAGIYVSDASSVSLSGNKIYDNDSGVNNTDSSQAVDATNTWWGDASGPYHPSLNPDGAGNSVSDNVLFDPWVRTLEADLIRPVVTLLGGPVTLDCGEEEYVDAGATAIDNVDGDITEHIEVDVIPSDLNLSLPGIYVFYYSVMDSSGNISLPVSRQVTVLDNCEGGGDCDAICEVPPIDEDGDGASACAECEFGTDPEDPDTDGDGMPDGWEIEFGLDPRMADGHLDPDEDGLTNLEEFQQGGNPTDSSSPNPVSYVSPEGADAPGRGTRTAPFVTIGYALAQASAGSRILLEEGTYPEDLALAAEIAVSSLDPAAPATIQGSITGAAGASLSKLVVAAAQGTASEVLLATNGATMEIDRVVFRGTTARAATGIVLSGASPSTISRCTFTSLNIGIDVEAALPILRRCVFDDLAFAGMVIRDPGAKQNDGSLGDQTDARTGWNFFDVTTIDSSAIVNETTAQIVMENNEWGTQSEEEIDAAIDGPADFLPFLGEGQAAVASSIACILIDATDQSKILGATVQLLPGTYIPVLADASGVYSFSALAAATYTLQVSAEGYLASSRLLSLQAGQDATVVIVLTEGEDPPPGPGCSAQSGGATRFDRGGLLCFASLALLLVFARRGGWTMRRVLR